MFQWLILLTLFVHCSLAFRLYDDIDDYHLWRRGESSAATPGTPINDKGCKKDILILWDNSKSIGQYKFNKTVVPFLINLINNAKLNVAKEGTHLGFITFSTEEKTKTLLNIGDKTEPDELISWLMSLNYEKDLKGGQTYTGKALKLANDTFNLTSPSNHRPEIGDVIMLFTDGKPNPNEGKQNEIPVANKFSKALKDKKVKIIGLAVGKEDVLRDFYPLIVKWSSSPEKEYVFKADLKELDDIVDKLVSPLCSLGGECSCTKPITPFTAYAEPGQQTGKVSWPKKEAKCTKGISHTPGPVDPPGSISGERYSLGKHVITYPFSYNNAGKPVVLNCSIEFTVDRCECPTQQVNGVIGPSEIEGLAEWIIPEPTCPARLTSPPYYDEIPKSDRGRFTEGEHTKQYIYTHTQYGNTFDIICDIKIKMQACKCPPVQTFKEILRPGESKAFVTWKEPNPNCKVTLESSDSTAPDGWFTVGKYTRQYTYRHETGFNMTCDVNIEVEGCECPIQTVNGVIGPSKTQGPASWEIPKPTCPADPKQPIPEPKGLFAEGEHTVQYVYTHTSAGNTFDITCNVNINMEACKCPPVQTLKKILRPGESKAFVTWKEPNPNCEVTLESSNSTAPDGLFTVGKYTRQYTYRHETGFSMTCDVNIEVEGELCRGKAINPKTEVCCCGEVHRAQPAQPGYRCCGMEYYNTFTHECCDEKRANVVPKGERCPNVVY